MTPVDRESLVKGVGDSQAGVIASRRKSAVSVTPVISRFERGLSGIGPGVGFTFQLPGSQTEGDLTWEIRLNSALSELDLASRSAKDWNLGEDSVAGGAAANELLLTESPSGALAAALELEKRVGEDTRKTLSLPDNPPPDSGFIDAIAGVEQNLVATLSKVESKKRPFWKKLIPERLRFSFEPASLGRGITPFGGVGADFYRSSRVKLPDQIRLLEKSLLVALDSKNEGIEQLFLALVTLRDSKERIENLKRVPPGWEQKEELERALKEQKLAEFTAKRWLEKIPEFSEETDSGTRDKELLRLAISGVSKRFNRDIINQAFDKLSSFKMEELREVFALKEKLLSEKFELHQGRAAFVESLRRIPSMIPSTRVTGELMGAVASKSSMLPGFPAPSPGTFSLMAVGELSATSNKRLQQLFVEALRREGELRARVLEERDQYQTIETALEEREAEVSLSAETNDLYRERARWSQKITGLRARFRRDTGEEVEKLSVSEPDYFVAQYERARIELELIKRGKRDLVLQAMAASDGSHGLLSLDLSLLTERPLKALFRKIFRSQRRADVAAAERNLQIIAYRAAEHFLEVEMNRELLLEKEFSLIKLKDGDISEDRRVFELTSLKSWRKNTEYEQWEKTIRELPKGSHLQTTLQAALNRMIGRDESIAYQRLSLQGEALRELYQRGRGDLRIANTLFSSLNEMGGTAGVAYSGGKLSWTDQRALRQIEQIDQAAIEAAMKFRVERRESVCRGEIRLGLAKELKELGNRYPVVASEANREALRAEIEADEQFRSVGLARLRAYPERKEQEAYPKPIGSSIALPVEIKDYEALAERAIPSFTREGSPVGRFSAKEFGVIGFLGRVSRGLFFTAGRLSLVEDGARRSENSLQHSEEDLQRYETELSRSRLKQSLAQGMARLGEIQSLTSAVRDYWRLKEELDSDPTNRAKALSLIDHLRYSYRLKERLEVDASRIEAFSTLLGDNAPSVRYVSPVY
jgi:hypothetical protein